VLVRAAISTAIVAVVALLAAGVVWPLASGRKPDVSLFATDPEATLRAFEAASSPIATVDVGSIYAGREELVDPREVLPTSSSRRPKNSTLGARCPTKRLPT
jgi:hypothetical protein